MSYNSSQASAAIELAKALKTRHISVWLDKWELVPGRAWQEALETAIESSASVAILVGKDGLGPWQGPEMRSFLDETVRRGVPVIPVLLPGIGEHPELPLFLRRFTGWTFARA